MAVFYFGPSNGGMWFLCPLSFVSCQSITLHVDCLSGLHLLLGQTSVMTGHSIIATRPTTGPLRAISMSKSNLFTFSEDAARWQQVAVGVIATVRSVEFYQGPGAIYEHNSCSRVCIAVVWVSCSVMVTLLRAIVSNPYVCVSDRLCNPSRHVMIGQYFEYSPRAGSQ